MALPSGRSNISLRLIGKSPAPAGTPRPWSPSLVVRATLDLDYPGAVWPDLDFPRLGRADLDYLHRDFPDLDCPDLDCP